MTVLTKQQILAFLAPGIATISGALAALLLVHFHVLGIFHVTESGTAKLIAGGLVFGLTAALTYLSAHHHGLPLAKMSLATGQKLTVPQILAFAQPYIAIIAGSLASWAFVHLHIFGFLHVTQSQVAQVIASGLVFTIVAVITWAAHAFHWLPIVTQKARRNAVRKVVAERPGGAVQPGEVQGHVGGTGAFVQQSEPEKAS